MNIEIRVLTPDLLEDYLYFFENVAHEDNEDEDRCYCHAKAFGNCDSHKTFERWIIRRIYN